MKTIGLDISVLNDRQKTGIGNYTFELIKAMLDQNHHDQFILFGLSPLANYNYLSNLEFKNHPNVKMKIIKMPSKIFRMTFIVNQKLNWPPIDFLTGPIDVFHSFNWYHPPQRQGKIVATIFDFSSLEHPEWHHPRTTQLDIIRFKRVAQMADQVITISEFTKNGFLNYAPASKVKVVYPAASTNFSQTVSESDLEKVLKKYSLKSGYFLSVATLEPRKNIKRLIEAYLQLKIDNPLVLVGKIGWNNQEMTELAKSYPKQVILTNFVTDEDLPALYKGALCLVYTSFYEGFGIPVLEAMLVGTPVICSNTTSLPEVGGEAVLYVDPLDISSISNAMMRVKKSKMLRQELIKKGIEQAKKFSWQKSALKQLNIYHQLVGR